MPRIRYRRSYDFSLYEQSDERTFEQNGEEDERSENPSGNSWLSNRVIAAQLSDAKIKQAIASLKAQITTLETELLSRRLAGRNTNGRSWDDIGKISRKQTREERLYPKEVTGSGTRQRGRRNSTFKKVASLRVTLKKLGVTNVDELLATWSKIQEEEKK